MIGLIYGFNKYQSEIMFALNGVTSAELPEINNDMLNMDVLNMNYDLTYEEWKAEMERHIYNLEDSWEIKIKNFDQNVYDLNDIDIETGRKQAEYTTVGNITKCVYKMDYTANFKLLTVTENSQLTDKLNQEEQAVYYRCREIIGNIITEEMSEYEKEKAIHDYIVLNTAYDYDNFKNGTVPDESYSITGLINNGVGVCNAYAYAFQLMAKMAELESYIIVGTMDDGSHAWNIVGLEGEYYHIDVTADDPAPDRAGVVNYNYYNLTDEMIAKNHTWDKSRYVACKGERYNYYVYNDCVITNYDELYALTDKKLSQGITEIEFYAKGCKLEDANVFADIARKYGYVNVNLRGELGESGGYVVSFD